VGCGIVPRAVRCVRVGMSTRPGTFLTCIPRLGLTRRYRICPVCRYHTPTSPGPPPCIRPLLRRPAGRFFLLRPTLSSLPEPATVCSAALLANVHDPSAGALHLSATSSSSSLCFAGARRGSFDEDRFGSVARTAIALAPAGANRSLPPVSSAHRPGARALRLPASGMHHIELSPRTPRWHFRNLSRILYLWVYLESGLSMAKKWGRP
jgi:hypothetical protein